MAGISARYWRVQVSANGGTTYTQIAELFLSVNGVDYTTSGKTYLGTTPSGGTQALVFDGAIGGNGQYAYWHTALLPFTIGVDMGSAVEVDTVGVAVSTFFTLTECPKDYKIQYSTDNSTWVDAFVATNQTSWVSGERKAHVVGDVNWSSVVALVNAEQTPPVDLSPSGRTLTLAGTAARSTSQKRFGSGSISFPGGNGNYLSLSNPTSFAPLGDFTIEMWVYISSMSTDGTLFSIDATGNQPGLRLTVYSSGVYYTNWNAGQSNASAGLTLNQWTHIAVTKSGNVQRVFVDGVQKSVDSTVVSSWTPAYMTLGGSVVTQQNFVGYIDDFRLTQGVARYTAAFSPPALPFYYVDGTPFSDTASIGTIALTGQQPSVPISVSLVPTIGNIAVTGQVPSVTNPVVITAGQATLALTGQSPSINTAALGDTYFSNVVLLMPFDGSDGSTVFTDFSTYSRTITPFGNAQVSTAQSKFGGASAKFDGTGDYLSTPDATELHITSGDFTIEAWVYRVSTTSPNLIVQKGIALSASEFTLFVDSNGYINFGIGVGANQSWFYSTSYNLPLSSWKHIAVTKSGSTIKVFVDGTQLSLNSGETLSTPTETTTHPLYIGRDTNNPDYDWDGYIDDLRITKGVARYTTSFTPSSDPNPTTPLPGTSYAVAGTISVIGQTAYFNAAPTVTDVTVNGGNFRTTTSISFELPNTASVNGQGFKSSLGIYGGSVVSGTGFATTTGMLVQANNEFSVIGGGFTSTLDAVVISASDIMVRGRGFKSNPRIYGGAVVSGAGFKTKTSIVASASERIAVIGGNFATSFSSNAVGHIGISLSGGGFTSALRRTVVTGSGFATTTKLAFEFDASYAQAFVMNLNTSEVTRYTNYPFIHVARVGNEEYGFALDGIYRLLGVTDGATKVNGQITTKDTDFNTQDFDGFQSKNVPLLYANTDDTIKVTAIVDGVALPRQTSQFDGRKTKLSRGARGRYWAMKVENITKLQGLEFLPEKLQRRVK